VKSHLNLGVGLKTRPPKHLTLHDLRSKKGSQKNWLWMCEWIKLAKNKVRWQAFVLTWWNVSSITD